MIKKEEEVCCSQAVDTATTKLSDTEQASRGCGVKLEFTYE